jgi:hypothetical protein
MTAQCHEKPPGPGLSGQGHDAGKRVVTTVFSVAICRLAGIPLPFRLAIRTPIVDSSSTPLTTHGLLLDEHLVAFAATCESWGMAYRDICCCC